MARPTPCAALDLTNFGNAHLPVGLGNSSREWLVPVPKGPRGEKRPADAIGLAVMIGKIATGEIEDDRADISNAAATLGRMGGNARASAMSPERRAEIAAVAAKARWGKKQGGTT